MKLTELSAAELLAAQTSGAASAVRIAQAYLDAIDAHDQKIHAYLHIDRAGALEQAQRIDARRQAGTPLGPLAGVPIAIKDLLCAAGQPTTCGSRILENFVPPYDAHVIGLLKKADAVLLGRTNMDEFAMGSSTENSGFQPTCNPWDVSKIPGGSSGGSAAAVAASLAPLALGTDTGGSIRQPAAHCGVVGLKPTYGRVSRFGLVAFASSLDQIGPIAHNVADCALLLEVIAGHDPRDSTSVDREAPAYRRALEEPIKPLTIGVPREYFGAGLDGEVEQLVRAAIAIYEKQGAKIVDVSLPHSPHAVAVYYLVATAEASSNLARYEGMHYGRRSSAANGLIETYAKTRDEFLGPEVKRRIMLGTYALSSGYKDAYYVKALKVRRLIRNDFDDAFKKCDVIMGPIAPTPAFALGAKTDDPLAMYLSDIYTIASNLAGIAAMSVPCGFTQAGLPVGLQLQVAPFEEEKLLRIARMHEQATDWHTRRPTI